MQLSYIFIEVFFVNNVRICNRFQLLVTVILIKIWDPIIK